MSKFDEFFVAALNEIKRFIAEEIGDFVEDIGFAGEKFLKNSRDDLENWFQLYNSGNLDKEELESLIKGKKDLLDIKILTQAGLAKIRIDRIKNGIFEIIIETGFARLI